MNRTNVILFALFLLLSSGQVGAQWRHSKADLPYRPAATFNGDTAAYLEFNYLIRNDQYIGRTVGDIIKELEYPVLYIVEAMSLHNFPDGRSRLGSLSLSVRQRDKELSIIHDYYIRVVFENPPNLAEYGKVRGAGNHPVFTPKLYDFIKDLKVSLVSVGGTVLKDPEILERGRQIQEENRRKARQVQEELDRRRRNQQ